MLDHIRQPLRLEADEGASVIEYGLMVALIAVVIIVVLVTLGDRASSRTCPADTTTSTTEAC